MFSSKSLGHLLLAGQNRKTGSYDLNSELDKQLAQLSLRASVETEGEHELEYQRRYDFTKQASRLMSALKRRSDSYRIGSHLSAHTEPNNKHLSLNNRTLKDGVTLCTLGIGTTFGASAASGKTHSVSVVTSDDCTLLRVRRADFQEVFNEQSHLIGDIEASPLCSSTSLPASRRSPGVGPAGTGGATGSGRQLDDSYTGGQAGVTEEEALARHLSLKSGPEQLKVELKAAGAKSGQHAPTAVRAGGRARDTDSEGAELEELGARLSLEPGEGPDEQLSSQLMRIGWLLRTVILHQAPQMIQNRRLVRQPAARQAGPGSSGSLNRKQLVSTGSSSQLLAGRSAASQAGRRVAGYVVSSLMRSRQPATPQPTAHLPASSSNSFELERPEVSVLMVRRSMLGRKMVDWLLNLGQASNAGGASFVGSRLQAVSMWQVLVEQGVIVSALPAPTGSDHRSQFQDDSQMYYQFWCDRDAELQQQQQQQSPFERPSDYELGQASESLWWALKVLAKLAPEACFRLILAKPAHERSLEEVDIVFEELQHLKALSHLGNGVKKQLAACVSGEHHPKQNTVIFNQGDQGQSWYIILRGSVNVVIVGKGVVCTLHEGDDFGKLALVNDAPRAATIVTSEPNCYFLRVDKLDFNTILRDVEANMVRLQEHGKFAV